MNTKEISEQLLKDYVQGKYAILSDDRFEFCIDGLTIRCKGHLEPVTKVATRFHKGLPRSGCTGTLKTGSRPSCKRPKFSEKIFNSFMEDGERNNAVNYALLYPVNDLNTTTIRVLNKVKRERECETQS